MQTTASMLAVARAALLHSTGRWSFKETLRIERKSLPAGGKRGNNNNKRSRTRGRDAPSRRGGRGAKAGQTPGRLHGLSGTLPLALLLDANAPLPAPLPR
jgi:hypothetical protein